MLGRMLRTWRSLCRRDLRRYPDRYPEPWVTGRISTRIRNRRRRRGAESARPAILLPCSHRLSPSFHRQESAAPSLNLRDIYMLSNVHTHFHNTYFLVCKNTPELLKKRLFYPVCLVFFLVVHLQHFHLPRLHCVCLDEPKQKSCSSSNDKIGCNCMFLFCKQQFQLDFKDHNHN